MAMLSTCLSPTQLVDLWMQLEDAYRGINRFGGHTAEIYAYTLLSKSPLADNASGKLGQEAKKEQAIIAAQALDDVLDYFSRVRECSFEIDGEEWGEVEPFDHRVHVRVIR